MSKPKVLFQFSGSIACYKACFAVSKLVQDGYEVRTVCTPSALKFIGAATLEGLTGHPVFTDAFEVGRAMDHIALAKWADLAILCPATANSINALAAGLGQDPIGTIFLAYDLSKPYLVAPAMNQEMFGHPATRDSLEKLRGWGVQVLPTGEGRQACGDVGPGRLLEPEQICQEVSRALEAYRSQR